MFFTKQKKIEHLQEIIGLKEAEIKEQQQTIEVLQHNIHAIMATYEQCDDRNRQLEGLTREQGGRLAVYEKLVGELPRHEEVSE